LDGREELAQILLVDGRASSQERIIKALKPIGEVTAISDPQAALFEAAENAWDMVIVNANFEDYDPLRLCSQLRSLERTRFLPILLAAEVGAEDMVVRALDLGINDYIVRPVDPNELLARTLTQIKRKRYNDRLRMSVRQTIELAVTDTLTGLHNRRYLDNHLKMLFDRSAARGRPLSACIVDIDRFKAVNDTFGHDAGDEVLKEFAKRVRSTVRGADLACRFGGEEFVVVMPDTDSEAASVIAERLRAMVESTPFVIKSTGTRLEMTASFGLSCSADGAETPAQLLKQADQALYRAKAEGRNRVVANAA
jgi:two-component system, cell cycle response regulator